MAFGYLLEWACVCAEQYRRLVEVVEWQLKVHEGDVVYSGDRTEGKLLAIETWPTRAAFEEYYHGSLLPALVEMGAQPPSITAWEIPDSSRQGAQACSLEARFGPWLKIPPNRKASLWGRN